MTRIQRKNGALISSRVQLDPTQKDPVQVKNRLLNGEFHIQTIGTAMDRQEVSFLCDKDQLYLFESAYATGEPLKVIPKTGDDYEVLIDMINTREVVSRGIVEYEVTASLVVVV